MKLLLNIRLILVIITLSACQVLPERELKPADVRDASIDAKVNPKNQQDSVLETLPLMNNAVLTLYKQAQEYYLNNKFDQAIASLERAFEIQPNVGKVSQLLAEIYLHKGNFDQAFYWSSLATKNGPSKGKSCEKSWRIKALAAEQIGDFAEQTEALENKNNCIVKAGNRF